MHFAHCGIECCSAWSAEVYMDRGVKHCVCRYGFYGFNPGTMGMIIASDGTNFANVSLRLQRHHLKFHALC